MIRPREAAEDLDEALAHLGNVLYIIQDIIKDHPYDTLVQAIAFYNERRPDDKIATEWLGKN